MSIGKCALAALFLVACGSGGDGDDAPPGDATPAPSTILVSGTAVEQMASDEAPLEGVLVEAFRNSDPNTVVTSAMTDAQGNYTLTIETNGVALDGFLKASITGLIDTYLYPPEPLAEDFDRASINLITTGTRSLLTGGIACDADYDPTKGMIAMLVLDGADMPVAGAVVSSTPAATSDCYNGDPFPSNDATGTDTDGIGYLFNVTGNASVTATANGLTFPSHQINVRPGVLTTTLTRP
jgi:hypothetical protein